MTGGQQTSHRLVSLMLVSGRMVESLVKDKIVKQIDEQAWLRENQHGFHKGKSCLMNLLEVFEKGQQACGCRTTCCQAFDMVPHERLLRKLHSQGIRGLVHSRIWN